MGGIKISEPAIDLAIVVAIASSYKNRAVSDKMIFIGEIGLSGEVRSVNMIENRVQEAKKLGFTSCVIPAGCMERIKDIKGIKLIPVSNVTEAIDLI